MNIYDKKHNSNNKLYLGIQILRIIFSFHILVFHCINKKNYKSKFVNSVELDLKTFFIISFYFSYNTFTSRNILKIKIRFKRLLIPYILWPVIFLIIDNINSFRNIILFKKIKYLYYQILMGIGINGVFWFLFTLIFLSILFLIIIFIFKKRYLVYLTFIGILSFLFDNSSFNKNIPLIFNKMAYSSIRKIPSSFISLFFGFYISSIKAIDKINKFKFKNLVRIIVFLLFCVFRFVNGIFNKYLYISIFIPYFSAISLFIFFMIFPFDNIKNVIYYNTIKILSTYSAGIYYIHNKVYYYLNLSKIKFEKGTMKMCIIIYILCYIICFFGHFTFKKLKLRYLFI